MHFGAFGQRQNTAWSGTLSQSGMILHNLITPRGFTGHEHADGLGIIHMNGRIYDPKLGRFLQADPFIQAPDNSQSLNRYSYVLNNPLSYTDPSGYFSLSKFVKKYWRVAAAAIATYVTYGVASGWAAGWLAGNAIAAGAVAGGLSGFVGGAILTGTLKGAFYGGLTGAALGAIGASGWKDISKSIASGTASGITADLQGGKFGHGFLSAGVGFWTGLKYGGPPNFGKFLGTAIAGGTISAVTGGKFGNGAFTAALAYVASYAAQRGSLSAGADADAVDPNREAFQTDLDALVEDGTLSSSRKFPSADAAATEVLNVTTPLSQKYGLEASGNIIPDSIGNYGYTIPEIGGVGSSSASAGYIAYHTHPSGNLAFSNQFNNYSGNPDTHLVAKSSRSLYLGVQINGAVRIGVCSPGSCPDYGRLGTKPSRILQ
jgi:RHS repeat-associated protein